MFSFTMNENSPCSAVNCAAAVSARSFNVISILADVSVLASVFAVLCGLILISAALAIISALLLGLIIRLIIIAGVPLPHIERTAPL